LKTSKNSTSEPSDSKKKYYEANKEAILAKKRTPEYKAYKRAYDKKYHAGRKKDPEKQRAAGLMRRYSLSVSEWDSMFYRQGFCCDICGLHDIDYSGRWHTDHDHATGEVRGILCQHCNSMLGYARDNSHTLAQAIHYLEKHNG
jgi:hypothetical protein